MNKQPTPTVAYREMDVMVEFVQPTEAERTADPAAEAHVTLALSSEMPVERNDLWSDKHYNEVLDHSAESVDLSYARDGMPLLLGHDTRVQIGILENVRLGADKKIRGDARFSKAQVGQEILQDIRDGIRKKVSVGYSIDTKKIEITRAEKEGGIDTYRLKGWTPREASIVPIPADYSVGIGRSAGDALPKVVADAIADAVRELSRKPTTAPKAKEQTAMPAEEVAASTAGVTVSVKERDESIKLERKRGTEIRALAAKHKVPADRAEKWIEDNVSVENVGMAILAEKQEKGEAGTPSGRPAVELNDRERQSYSFQRAIMGHVEEAEGKGANASFERDIHQELEKKVPDGITRRGGFLVPTFTNAECAREIMARQNGGAYATRAGLDSATSTKGVELKFTVPGEFLEILRNFMVTMQAGTTLMAGLQGPVAFPSQTASGTATWVGENPGSDVAESNLLLAQIALNPKSIQSTTSYSRQLIAQSVVDVDALVKTDLAQTVALALDLAVIAGTGAANQPTGVTATSGIGSVALGTNGLTPVYNNLVDLETQVTAANADQWPLTYLIHPSTRGTFKKAVPLGNTVGEAVWTDANIPADQQRISGGTSRRKGELNGYDAYASAQVPNNLTKGTSVGTALAIILGAWSQAVVGDWGMMEIIVDPYRLKKQGMIEVTTFAMYGIAIKYPKAFAAILDALV